MEAVRNLVETPNPPLLRSMDWKSGKWIGIRTGQVHPTPDKELRVRQADPDPGVFPGIQSPRDAHLHRIGAALVGDGHSRSR